MTTRKEKSTICETCGETDKDKLLVFKPICYTCRNKKYVKPKDPRKEPKIKINIPDGIEDRKTFYKKEWQRIYHQLNKDSVKLKRKIAKRIKILKKYCDLLNRDVNEYLKNNPSDDDLKIINKSLKEEYYDQKRALNNGPKVILEPDYYVNQFKNKIEQLYDGRVILVGEYKNRNTKTVLSCKEHNNEIIVNPDHLPKNPCPICLQVELKNKYRTDFKKRLNDRFADQLTLVGEYNNQCTITVLSCKEHGEFEVIPQNIFDNKYPCPSCRIQHGFAQSEIKQGVVVKGLSNEELIQKSIELYGDRYDYSKFNYIRKRDKVIFICKEHGEFEQKYESHIMGFQGCKKCAPHDKQFFNEKMLSHKLYLNLREHITRSLKHLGVEYKKYDPNYSSIKICGLKKEDFLRYLETKMEPWMTWSNYGLYNGTPNHGWDLDHIIPRNTVTTLDDFYNVYHYTNIQPLCSYINRDVKKDKILK